MPRRTKTFTIDAAPGHELIQPVGPYAKRITIREKPAAGTIPYVGGTGGYQIFGVQSDGTPDTVAMTRYAGEITTFERPVHPTVDPFKPGEIIAYISALAGTMTMEQIEEY